MKIEQVFTLVNNATKEAIGSGPILKEDLSNVVDMGAEIYNTQDGPGNFVKSLVDQIGKIIVSSREYTGRAPSVLMDNWEYGSVVEKIHIQMPEATANQSWALQDKKDYTQDVFHEPKVSVKFFKGKVTFNIEFSIPDVQLKPAFQNGTQMGAFVAGLYTAVKNSMTVKLDKLIKSTINNFIAETIYDEYPAADYTTKSGVRAVNLLKEYNDLMGTTIAKKDCMTNRDFLRYAVTEIQLYYDRLQELSVLFNMGGTEKHTPADKLHVLTLSNFQRSATNYLESDTYHNEFLKMPNSEIVSYWQGTGTDFSFANTSKIHVAHDTHEVELDGVICAMFDRDALGVTQKDQRTTTHYNGAAEFTNVWAKADAHYFNDINENFVVFFVA